jgi:hypothetical protein
MTNSEKANNRTLAGKCLCGAVQYAVTDEFLYAANCHCSNCRRATGSAFKPFAGIERNKVRITKGEDNLMIFGDEYGCDTRCNVCGAFLYSVVRDGAFVHVAMGTLVDDPTIRPTGHILSALRRGGSRSPTTCSNTKSMWWSPDLPVDSRGGNSLPCQVAAPPEGNDVFEPEGSRNI